MAEAQISTEDRNNIAPKETRDDNSVFLPPEVLGSFEEAILGSQADKRERSQWIKKQKPDKFNYSKVFVGEYKGCNGSCRSTGKEDAEYRAKQDLCGFRKPYIYFHTHTDGNWLFSPKDIAAILAFPRSAQIFLVGSASGISAISFIKPPSYVLFKEYAYNMALARLEQNDYQSACVTAWNSGDVTDIVQVLKKLGLNYYFWRPKQAKIQKGTLTSGIHLISPKETHDKPASFV
jgi:hypothetical protein